jgi:hypothetical protein
MHIFNLFGSEAKWLRKLYTSEITNRKMEKNILNVQKEIVSLHEKAVSFKFIVEKCETLLIKY